MSSEIAPLRGMKDLLPKEYRVAKYIEDVALKTSQLYGFEGFSTPILESASVFDRTLGDTSDVVSKEMYCFPDKKGRLIALRPEFTASVMRAVISNGLKHKLPLKLFSSGPLFRYDRPQEGRQRQFHQINIEHIGAKGPFSDAEIIKLAVHILSALGLKDDVDLELTSLGCAESRADYQKVLIEYFKKYEPDLSADSRARLHQNPLRILDSKDEKDKEIVKNAPVITGYYTKEAAEYFKQVISYLDMFGVKYVLNPKLARGLDYYSHTTFEFTTKKLGAQSTVLAGGRYDGLSALMGEDVIPSIGFAAGIERLALLGAYNVERERPNYIFPMGQDAIAASIKLADDLRQNNIQVLVESDGKVAKRIQQAVSAKAKYAIFIGGDEIASGMYKLKNLDTGEEKSFSPSEIKEQLR
ncbi:MAG: histidine--tRNA ligase [Rickettsiales bacterium]|nr:histidine--tRNA ligase [Rickettsiales bacterium]MCA0254388.1 histidine--tRNA ligase [Pseudomonadota bacterium]